MKVHYQEHSLDEVMHYFYQGFKEKVTSADYFIDTFKGKVVFKVYIAEDGDIKKG